MNVVVLHTPLSLHNPPAKPQKRLRSQLNDYVEGKGMRARKDVSCVDDDDVSPHNA